MQKGLLCLLVVYNFIACNNNTSNQNTADSIAKPTNDTTSAVSFDSIKPQLLCYAYTQNGDTVRMNITASSNIFTGHLLYHIKEKDRNKGTLQGIINGDTLIADYTFSSEGMQSVRQVAFIKKQNNLQEGFGEITEKNGKMMFTNTNSLQFTGFLLAVTACE